MGCSPGKQGSQFITRRVSCEFDSEKITDAVSLDDFRLNSDAIGDLRQATTIRKLSLSPNSGSRMAPKPDE